MQKIVISAPKEPEHKAEMLTFRQLPYGQAFTFSWKPEYENTSIYVKLKNEDGLNAIVFPRGGSSPNLTHFAMDSELYFFRVDAEYLFSVHHEPITEASLP